MSMTALKLTDFVDSSETPFTFVPFCFISFMYNLYYFFFLLPFLFLAPHVEFRWVFCFILQSFKATPIPLQSTNLNMFTS